MCRWITVISAETVSLSDVVLAPANSLVKMSKDASFHPGQGDLNNSTMNGDGFGVGWYHYNISICPNMDAGPSADGGKETATTTTTTPRVVSPTTVVATPQAAVFKDIYPAWNNMNLRELCMSTSSHCIMAHVRAASRNTGVSFQNCHPFKAGRLMFCHNGRIDQFSTVRRKFLDIVSDEAFGIVRGTTDSEVIFALILTALEKDGQGSPVHQTEKFGYKRLVRALKSALKQIEILLIENGLTEGYSTLNFSLTDGDTMVVTRFCDKSPEVPPPSLYFAYGTAKSLYQELTSEDCDDPPLMQAASEHGMMSDTASDTSASETDESLDAVFDERMVHINQKESRPGKQMIEVDPSKASFIVSSNPLTRTHTWHVMPSNSIMWCTRGSHPELRLLRRRLDTRSVRLERPSVGGFKFWK